MACDMNAYVQHPLGEDRGPDVTVCLFVVEDTEDLGMSGMNVVQVQLFFSLIYDGVLYSLALVDWFKRGGATQ
jgi:hypothetical protein